MSTFIQICAILPFLFNHHLKLFSFFFSSLCSCLFLSTCLFSSPPLSSLLHSPVCSAYQLIGQLPLSHLTLHFSFSPFSSLQLCPSPKFTSPLLFFEFFLSSFTPHPPSLSVSLLFCTLFCPALPSPPHHISSSSISALLLSIAPQSLFLILHCLPFAEYEHGPRA